MRILLVDDSTDIRECYRAFLEQMGHEVAEAISGKNAVARALQFKPQMIFMDLSLPDIDGIQATSALRAISTFTHLPIIAMTAHTGMQWQEKATAAGCDAYLEKPLSRSTLAGVIERFTEPLEQTERKPDNKS
jgi:CheY-like chemotaxis protein